MTATTTPLMAWERELLALAQAEAEKRLAGVLAAHRVLGTLITAMPSDVEIATWRIHDGGIEAQRQSGGGDARTRTEIRSLAGLFVFDYAEKRSERFTTVSASGEIDGVRVEFWDHVERARQTGATS